MTSYEAAVTAGYQVETDELTEAGTAIVSCTSDAEGIQVPDDVGESERYGHEALYAAISEFALAWQLVLEELVESGEGFRRTLDGACEQYVSAEVGINESFGGQ